MLEEFLENLFCRPRGRTELTVPLCRRIRCEDTAFKSTDECVAFLIETEGKWIYHAGDLNNWVWDGEPKQRGKR